MTPSPGEGGAGAGAALAWRCVPFDSLTPLELERIYAARQRVFAVEQGCAYLDADGCDELAHHLVALAPAVAEPLAYARLLAPGAKYAEASIGRVLTRFDVRSCGLGRELMERALALVATIWPATAVRISAQTRLEGFYASLGFVAIGAAYLEDGIDHTEMLRPADAVAPFESR
jgi:ElaA protein